MTLFQQRTPPRCSQSLDNSKSAENRYQPAKIQNEFCSINQLINQSKIVLLPELNVDKRVYPRRNERSLPESSVVERQVALTQHNKWFERLADFPRTSHAPESRLVD